MILDLVLIASFKRMLRHNPFRPSAMNRALLSVQRALSSHENPQFGHRPLSEVLSPFPIPVSHHASLVKELAERTFIAIKPDAVQRGLVGEIISRFERRGFKLLGIKATAATRVLVLRPASLNSDNHCSLPESLSLRLIA